MENLFPYRVYTTGGSVFVVWVAYEKTSDFSAFVGKLKKDKGILEAVCFDRSLRTIDIHVFATEIAAIDAAPDRTPKNMDEQNKMFQEVARRNAEQKNNQRVGQKIKKAVK
jgi:hypothetical protein